MEETKGGKIYYIIFNDDVIINDDADEDIVYYTSKEKAIEAIKECLKYYECSIYYNDGETIKAIDPNNDEVYVFKVGYKDADNVINVSHHIWGNILILK